MNKEIPLALTEGAYAACGVTNVFRGAQTKRGSHIKRAFRLRLGLRSTR